MRHPLVNVVDIAGVHRPVLCAGAVHACVVVLVSPMLALRVPAVHRLLCMLAVCALALPMLALRAPAVPALAVRACAVRFRAVCGVLVQRSSTSCGARRPCIPVDPGDLP